ncbi:hypothetical protein LCGC14_1125400 [marine sediment metagenome]|uniref:Uncharacterized protein n=1 Tax=marine sediment metagenome TaxID=412755 RepID=A0A0F9M2S5_9ZZZZ
MCDDKVLEWSKKYNEVIKNRPVDGSILVTVDGSLAKLTVEIVDGSAPFIYGRLYVPEIIGIELGWFLQGAEVETYHGWKCILMPRARADLIKKIGLSGDTVLVKSLRLVRESQSGKSFLCEVKDYE